MAALYKGLVVVGNWLVLLIVLNAGVFVSILQLIVSICPGLSAETRIDGCQRLANTWWILFPYTILVWAKIPVFWYGDSIESDTSMILGNHRTTLDFSIGALTAAHAECIGCGRMIPLMKNILKFMPGVGWICYFSGALFLRRKWGEDHRAIKARVEEMVSHYPRPFWLGIYPEGTRFSEKKMAEAQSFAKKRNEERKGEEGFTPLPILKHTLLPRPKGFIFFAQHKGLRACLDSVHDITVGSYGGDPKLTQFLGSGGFRTKALHIYIKKQPISSLPTEKEELEKWIYACFVEKDKRLAYLKQNGRYPPEDIPRIPSYAPNRLSLCATFSVWALLWIVVVSYLAHWLLHYLNVILVVSMICISIQNALEEPPSLEEGKKKE